MARYLAMRVAQSLFTVFLIVSTVFVLVRLAPGDPAAAIGGPTATTEDLQAIREELGLVGSIPHQYWHFITGLVQGDLGLSYSFRQPALEVVLDRLPYTITLAGAAILLTALIAIPLGIFTARRANSSWDVGANIGTIAGQSMPEFWTGIMLLTLLSVVVPIFPASGFTSWSGLVLPAVTIALLQIALISRLVHREMAGNLAAPFVTVARSRGVAERALTWRYAFANSSIPVVTALGTRFAAMLNGVVVVEVVFAWPGIGSLVVRALETRDYPLIQATVLVTSLLAIGVQLLVDLLYPLFDPRVRVGKAVSR
ncbi:ABC transporter permease [Jiangella endophytica]|uniref:ABC transporter permease n=1 Tax=Jiangella endophytica TaxID=1623398 RepID=UPI000E357A9B|nr:ABC transporter permease [Jiangella endophytica]